MPPVLAAGEAPEFLAEVAAILAAGALIAYLGSRLGLVPIVGFLAAGVLIGPNALGVVESRELVDSAAEVGVILLLFTIGLELSLDRLSRMRGLIFGVGGAQVAITTGICTGVGVLAGVSLREAIYTGFLISLSSTAIVLSLLSSRGEMGEERGRLAVGVLIFQDLAIVPMVLLVPVLGTSGGSIGEIAVALAIALGLIAVILTLARRLMPAVLEVVARTCAPEVFLITVAAICFVTAYVTSLAGVSVSLGAFLAGLVVSESRFGQHALGEIMPLQILFSGTFFVSVGMLLDPGFILDSAGLVAVAIAAVLAVKLAATALSARLAGVALPIAGATGLLLAQVGEFSFVLERVGAGEGLRPAGLDEGGQLLIATTVLLMAATPPLMSLGARWTATGGRGTPASAPSSEQGIQGASVEAELPHRDHVIVAGYGDAARAVSASLRATEMPFVVTTLNPGAAREAADEGIDVLRGDHTKAHLLVRAGVHHARLLVVADDELEVAYRVVSVARALNRDLDILVRAPDEEDVEPLARAGASRVITDARAVRERLPAAVLGECGVLVEGPIDSDRIVNFEASGQTCSHFEGTEPVRPSSSGCEACLRSGDEWVHLRVCLTCGHVGCCESSPNRHASAHSEETGHPLMASAEPGDGWAWCYEDRLRVNGLLVGGASDRRRAG